MKLKLILTTAIVGVALALPNGVSAAPFVYVANLNSNDVSQYDVGAGGLLAPLSPAAVATGGLDPAAVAVSPDGGSVYVANVAATSSDISGSVAQFDVGAGGVLSPKSPATVATGTSPFGVAVSPDGGSVYVTNLPSSVSQYDVGPGGVLSPKSPATVAAGDPGLGPAIGVAVIPTTKVSTSPPIAASAAASLSSMSAREVCSRPRPGLGDGGLAAAQIAVSPDGGSVYVTNLFSDNVSQYDVGAGGALSPKSPATIVGPRRGLPGGEPGRRERLRHRPFRQRLPVRRRRGRAALPQEPGHGGRRHQP